MCMRGVPPDPKQHKIAELIGDQGVAWLGHPCTLQCYAPQCEYPGTLPLRPFPEGALPGGAHATRAAHQRLGSKGGEGGGAYQPGQRSLR